LTLENVSYDHCDGGRDSLFLFQLKVGGTVDVGSHDELRRMGYPKRQMQLRRIHRPSGMGIRVSKEGWDDEML
jgi:hypothetical protein